MNRTIRVTPPIIFAILVTALVTAGCSEATDPTTDPTTDPPPPPSSIDVTGTWMFRDHVTATWWTLELTQHDLALTGTHRNGEREVFNQRRETIPGSGDVTGRVSGDSVILLFDTDQDGTTDVFPAVVSEDELDGFLWNAKTAQIPSVPANLQATAISSTDIELNWAWTPNPTDRSYGDEGFIVEWRCCGASFQTLFSGDNRVPAEAREALVESLPAETTFEFRIKAGLTERFGARWFEYHSEFSNVAAATTLPPPAITSLTPNSGPVGAPVLITGMRISPLGAPPTATVGSVSATEFIVSYSDTSLELMMPNAGASGDHPVVIYAGAESNALTWTQLGQQDSDEPANDDPDTASEISLPADRVGSFLDGDVFDTFRLTLNSNATLAALLDWNMNKDLDVLVLDSQFSDFVCGQQGNTPNKPEELYCPLPAGDYYILIRDYDAATSGDFSPVSYRLMAEY
jgi:hypothetical protein